MASVYLARIRAEAGFQRLCAVKCLHPHLADDSEAVTMLLDEARLAGMIHHPNVVSVLDLGQDGGQHFIAMQLVEGASLDEILRGGRVPTPILLRVILDALEGLDAAHNAVDDTGTPLYIVHRDVSPQNILVGLDGRARITDFGVAHAAARLRQTQGIELKGKLPYMAPEQLEGKPVDLRTDIFGMGLVLWEGLAGRPLFTTADRSLLDKLAVGGDVPEEFSTSTWAALDRVCVSALARERDGRVNSARAFAKAIARAVANSPGVATHDEVTAFIEVRFGDRVRSRRRYGSRTSSTPPAPFRDDPLDAFDELAAEQVVTVEPLEPTVVIPLRQRRRPFPFLAMATALLMVLFAAVIVRVLHRTPTAARGSPESHAGADATPPKHSDTSR
jgi:serine/threonine-protein kinase